jgi:diaminohydroxyphosphoribosylaminopyrimidine deaminase / 5-amino-6-(5-phosphoribosylamino)uracil reductase
MTLDQTYLLQALSLAQIQKGFTAPNPSVGAVVVKDGIVIGTGYHYAPGHPHAEVEALKSLGKLAQGATVYVSLEPCCHYGRTPPCTDRLIQHRVARVVYGFRDPNPVVAGKGAQVLQQAGIACEYLPLPEIDLFYQSYAFWTQHHRPWVTVKLAMSLDGKIAGKGGAPCQITGSQLTTFTHQQRGRADAILTTAKTIIVDNPALNVRLHGLTQQKPLYLLDRRGECPLNANILSTARQVTLFHGKELSQKRRQQLTAHGILCHLVPTTLAGLDLVSVLAHLGREGVHDLWVEAGGTCFRAFIEQELAQRAYLYIAPVWLGDEATGAFPGFSGKLLSHARRVKWSTIGEDGVIEAEW